MPRIACRILVVDDFKPWRRFICSALQKQPGIRVVGEAEDGLEALQRAAELKPDLVLLDIDLPKLNGIEVAHRMGDASPGTKILFESQSNNAELVGAALSNGAQGYIWKMHAALELLPAIHAIRRGDKFVGSLRPH